MTLPEVQVGQTWRRADGTKVLIEKVNSPTSFFASGTYYTYKPNDKRYLDKPAEGRYLNPGGSQSVDLVELCDPQAPDVQSLEGLYQHALQEFGEGKPAVSRKPTLPALAEGQKWRRRDGREVVVSLDDEFGHFRADGYFYDVEPFSGLCYEAPGVTNHLDLLEYLGQETAECLLDEAPSKPRRMKSFSYRYGVFFGLAEDGTAWYLKEADSAWIQLPPLPCS